MKLSSHVSKADLLEVAWVLASLCNDGGCDDETRTLHRLVEELFKETSQKILDEDVPA